MATEHHKPRASSRQKDRADLLRLLHGELSPAEQERLRGRLAREPELAATLRRMEVTWDRLELPPGAAAPPGFAARVAARAAEERRRGAADGDDGDRALFRPAWARAMAAAALVAGIVTGGAVGWLVIPQQPPFDKGAPGVQVVSPDRGAPGAAGSPSTAASGTEQTSGSEPATAGAMGADTGSDSLDALATGSVESLAESYWSAFAPEDSEGDGTTGGGETLR